MKNTLKKSLTFMAAFVLITGAGLFIFREPLHTILMNQVTKDMFLATDEDSYDPGLEIGERFPDILASYQGSTISGIEQFTGEKGTVFIAIRSVDW